MDQSFNDLKFQLQKTKEFESLNYQYRQKILKEHEMIKLKEQEIEKQRIANEESLKFQKAKLDVMERELQKKLAEPNGYEDVIRRKYEAQIHAAKVSAETEFYEEREQIRNKLKQLEGDLRNMENLKSTIKTLQRENEQLVDANKKQICFIQRQHSGFIIDVIQFLRSLKQNETNKL